ncbi:hypothetical protein V8E52_011369 [Russula decolorans]
MLVHSPPLPLIIDHVLCGDFEVSKEEGLVLMLALKQCDPVRLPMAVPNLLNFVIAINEEFSNLEHLVIKSSRFTNILEHLKFDSAKFEFFKDRVHIMFYPHTGAKLCALSISVDWWYLDWQEFLGYCICSTHYRNKKRKLFCVPNGKEKRLAINHMSVRAIRPVHASDARWLYLRFDDVLSQARRLRVADGGRPVERGDGACPL